MGVFNQQGKEHGAALVEFAIVLPLLLILLLGMSEFGLLFYNKQVLTNASREGARAGITRADSVTIKALVDNYCLDRLITFDSAASVTTTTAGVGGDYGEDLSVSVGYTYTFLVPALLGFGTTMNLSAKTVMKMEELESS